MSSELDRKTSSSSDVDDAVELPLDVPQSPPLTPGPGRTLLPMRVIFFGIFFGFFFWNFLEFFWNFFGIFFFGIFLNFLEFFGMSFELVLAGKS